MNNEAPKARPPVFVVNPDQEHREEVRVVLARLYDVSAFDNNPQALAEMMASPPDLVVMSDTLLEGGQGLLFDKRKEATLSAIPFIVIGKSDKSILTSDGTDNRDGLDAYISRPFSKNKLITQISNSLSSSVEKGWEKLEPVQKSALQKSVEEFKALSAAIENREPLDLEQSYESCKPLAESINNQNIQGILDGVKGHHNYTYVHSLRVATYLSLFGHAIGIRGDDLLTLSTGGLLHDVGKMVTPQDMLNKGGKLSDQEFSVMKSHVDHTSDILNRTPGVTAGIRIIAEQHHEKLNGKGYPKGLKANELNELARMSGIVDIFGALTDARSYKPAFPAEKAFAILEDMDDGLDQSLVKIFRETLEEKGLESLALEEN